MIQDNCKIPAKRRSNHQAMAPTWQAYKKLVTVCLSLLLAANLLAECAPTPAAAVTPAATFTYRPVTFSFLKNPQCRLHRNDNDSRSVRCGMKELGVKGSSNGVVFWEPGRCSQYYCQCVVTQEIRREKRSIVDNKTTTDYQRFRIFECV